MKKSLNSNFGCLGICLGLRHLAGCLCNQNFHFEIFSLFYRKPCTTMHSTIIYCEMSLNQMLFNCIFIFSPNWWMVWTVFGSIVHIIHWNFHIFCKSNIVDCAKQYNSIVHRLFNTFNCVIKLRYQRYGFI